MNYKEFVKSKNLTADEVFCLVLGENSLILPGDTWSEYSVILEEEYMLCHRSKDDFEQTIRYESFKQAEFGIGSGNLWLQCIVDGKALVFCSPRKFWKSSAGKKLIEKIGEHIEIGGMKEYKKYTGKLFFLYMFK